MRTSSINSANSWVYFSICPLPNCCKVAHLTVINSRIKYETQPFGLIAYEGPSHWGKKTWCKGSFVNLEWFLMQWHLTSLDMSDMTWLTGLAIMNCSLFLSKNVFTCFDREFVDLLLSPASKVLNKWFEVVI